MQRQQCPSSLEYDTFSRCSYSQFLFMHFSLLYEDIQFMALEHTDVQRAAYLARLGLTDDEASRYADDLGRILEMVDKLQTLDTEGVAPLAHPLDATQQLRADEVTESDQRDHFQRCAPAVEDGLYLVPRVVE